MGKIWSANQLPARILYSSDGLETYGPVDSSTETLIAPRVNIPAGYMAEGRLLRARLFGLQSNVVTTPGTLILRTRWVTTAANVAANVGGIFGATASLSQSATAFVNSPWMLDITLGAQTSGSPGTNNVIMVTGMFFRKNHSTGSGIEGFPADDSNGYLSGTVPLDSTIQAWLSITATFSVATAGTAMTTYSYMLQSLN